MLITLKRSPISCLSPANGLYSLTYFGYSYKWDHTIYNLAGLGSFTQHIFQGPMFFGLYENFILSVVK